MVFGGFFIILKKVIIKNINCESQYGPCNGTLLLSINNLKKKSILDTRNDLNNLLKKDNSIVNYSIYFQLPSNFRVNVIERKAIVAFAVKDSQFDLVDSQGNILTQVKTTALPIISTSLNLDHDQIIYISNLTATIFTYYGSKSAKVSMDGIEIDNIKGKKVIFPLSGDQDTLLGSLALIISRLPSVKETSTIGTIDLRYKNPVLR